MPAPAIAPQGVALAAAPTNASAPIFYILICKYRKIKHLNCLLVQKL
jgi:hypothetical protein